MQSPLQEKSRGRTTLPSLFCIYIDERTLYFLKRKDIIFPGQDFPYEEASLGRLFHQTIGGCEIFRHESGSDAADGSLKEAL